MQVLTDWFGTYCMCCFCLYSLFVQHLWHCQWHQAPFTARSCELGSRSCDYHCFFQILDFSRSNPSVALSFDMLKAPLIKAHTWHFLQQWWTVCRRDEEARIHPSVTWAFIEELNVPWICSTHLHSKLRHDVWRRRKSQSSPESSVPNLLCFQHLCFQHLCNSAKDLFNKNPFLRRDTVQ